MRKANKSRREISCHCRVPVSPSGKHNRHFKFDTLESGFSTHRVDSTFYEVTLLQILELILAIIFGLYGHTEEYKIREQLTQKQQKPGIRPTQVMKS